MNPASPQTHAEASRQRRDLVSGQVMEEARLVRFVAGPDGVVTPDLAAIATYIHALPPIAGNGKNKTC